MTEDSGQAAESPRQLLLGTRELTRRVRRAQRGAWFPLVLLGLVVVGAAPFYRVGPHPHATCTAVVTRGPGGIPASLRIAGLTAIMYDIVTNVVTPASTSRRNVVPLASRPK